MKKLTFLAITLTIFSLINAQTRNYIDQPYIEVSGSADTLVTPNEIYISIFISEKDTRDRVSIEELEQKMISALSSLGIDTEKDLTLSDISSNFKFYFLKEKDVIKTKLFTLKIKDAETAGKVLVKLEETGISNTSIERVEHSDMDNLKNKMRSKAIEDAKKRAIVLTKPLDQTIGPAIHIAEPEIVSHNLHGSAPGIQIRGIKSFKKSDYKEFTNIEFEKIKVSANISVKFILN